MSWPVPSSTRLVMARPSLRATSRPTTMPLNGSPPTDHGRAARHRHDLDRSPCSRTCPPTIAPPACHLETRGHQDVRPGSAPLNTVRRVVDAGSDDGEVARFGDRHPARRRQTEADPGAAAAASLRRRPGQSRATGRRGRRSRWSAMEPPTSEAGHGPAPPAATTGGRSRPVAGVAARSPRGRRRCSRDRGRPRGRPG